MRASGINRTITNGRTHSSTGEKGVLDVQNFKLFLRQQICRDPGSVYSTAYLQAKQDGTFEVVTPHATAAGGTTFQPGAQGAKMPDSNKLSINVSLKRI